MKTIKRFKVKIGLLTKLVSLARALRAINLQMVWDANIRGVMLERCHG